MESDSKTMGNPMGETKKSALRVSFDRSLKLEFHGSKVTSDSGLLAYRELEEVLGVIVMAEDMFDDWRCAQNDRLAKNGTDKAQTQKPATCLSIIYPSPAGEG